jgi:hypothetical protein
MLDIERGPEKLGSKARFDPPEYVRLDLTAAVELIEQGERVPRGFR